MMASADPPGGGFSTGDLRAERIVSLTMVICMPLDGPSPLAWRVGDASSVRLARHRELVEERCYDRR
jgi:hypothetical protein